MTRLVLPGADAAAEMRLIGLLLQRPTESVRRQARELAREVKDPKLRAIAAALEAVDEAAYIALFGPGGAVSPREVAYRPREDPGWIMADVSAFYAAFGFQPATEDPVDHVAVEVGFVAYLELKELYAAGREEAASVTASARVRFVSDHLSTLASGIVARLRSLQAPDYLDLARALWATVGGPDAPPEVAEDPGDDEGLTCGPCGAGPSAGA